MKKTLFIYLLLLIQFSILAQKVTIQVIKTENIAASEWQIFDEDYRPVFSWDEYFREDTISINLEANKHYLLKISVSDVYYNDSSLYSLWLNGEPILLITSEARPGDHFYPFFTGIKEMESKITGGTNADISYFPWQVFYLSGDYTCGGTIISPDWIVTAAHCTENSNGNKISPSKMAIKVGANNPYNTLEGKIYYINEVIVNEGYNSSTLQNDIALLRLKDPINFENAKPIKLISDNDVANGSTDPGVMSWVTGWGLTKVVPETYPTKLQKVQLPIISNAQAATVWKNIPETTIMAGYLNGNKDACNGDSGGPLIVPVSDEYKLAGIVSWGSSKCDTYGGYTRISSFESWIRAKTGIAKEYIPPIPVGDTLVCQGIESSRYSIETLPSATSYEWKLLPEKAGIITWNSGNAFALWDTNYTGSASVKLRVTINNIVSEWSKLNVKIAMNTELINKSRDTALCEGQPVTLKVEAEGYNLNYNWYHDGNLAQSGKLNEMNFESGLPVNSGKYLCEIKGSCKTIITDVIKMTIHPLTRISYVSPNNEVAFGDAITIYINAEGHDLMYQWQKNGELLDNSNVSQFGLKDVDANDIGLYYATVKGTCGTEKSDTIYVFVKKENYFEEPEVFLWPTITDNELNIAMSNNEYYGILLFDTYGKLIKKQTNCHFRTTININSIPRGVYFITIYKNDFRKSLKFIKI
jgi:hypothetical protein